MEKRYNTPTELVSIPVRRIRVSQRKLIFVCVSIVLSAAIVNGAESIDLTRTVFEPMSGSLAVDKGQAGGQKAVRMRCNFKGTRIDRASWDFSANLDLTMSKGVEFDFYCADASPVSHFSMYFHSGNGWYSAGFSPSLSTGWNKIRIDKNSTSIEGTPAGWTSIDKIRISAWRGGNVNTVFYMKGLRVFGDSAKIIIIRADSVAQKSPDELKSVTEFADGMAQFLDAAGLSHVVVSDLDISSKYLKSVKLIILPHNPSMPDKIAETIGAYLKSGGRMISCYSLPDSLQRPAGIRNDAFIRQSYPGQFSSIVASANPLKGAPKIVKQASWNIRNVLPVKGRSRIAAWWNNDKGQTTGKAAIVKSDNTIHLTHVLLDDDRQNKLQLLLAMIGNLCPDLWRDAANGSIEAIANFGSYDDFNAAFTDIAKLANGNTSALKCLNEAASIRRDALKKMSAGDYSQAIITTDKARKSMIEAYCLAQQPLPGEHRAFWCHSAFGVKGMTWDEAIKNLADNGFTAILPNMLWGGVAFFQSDVLPTSPSVTERGDQIELCLAACKKYGIECHVWKVNFNMGYATDREFVAKMNRAARTQVSFDGTKNERWLCPSHPANQKLEIAAMLEVGRKYNVDGIHFDYIRYPGRDGCFCSGCRDRFEKSIGGKVTNWPGDVRTDENLIDKWNSFRRRQITNVVSAVAAGAEKIRPNLEVSAAVFRNWPSDRDTVGQDWKLWCERGYLDFVCPMDYTPLNSLYERMVTQQQQWIHDVPCYPGIGLSVWNDRTDVVKLIEQINITRKHKTGGFTIFNYSQLEAQKVLPALGRGITKKQ